MIELENVGWAYNTGGMDGAGGAAAPGLRDLDLTVGRGETVLLCGPSGCGKSSVLKLVNGLIPHFHEGTLTGKVTVDGVPVPDTPIDRVGRLTATVFQNPRTQFFAGDVTSEIAFALENAGLPAADIERRVRSAADALDVGGLLGRDLGGLSGGQQQQVACAAAKAIDPEVYLFDEPTSNLSAAAIDRITALVRRLRADGRTILIAEHRLYFLKGLVDWVVVMRDGAITGRFTGAEFWRLPAATRREMGLRSLERPEPPRLPTVAAGPSPRPGPAPDAGGLEIRDVRFAYGDTPVLDIGGLRFPSGTVTALTGPNGAGKSTLARAVCGLLKPGGSFVLDGAPMPARRRLRASYIVMQDVNRQLFTDSVETEMRLGARAGELDPARIDRQLAESDLDGARERHPLALSGGQKQRLVVATARLTRRRVYVFDEPSSGVDHRHLRSITEVLRSLAAEGAVVIVITHDDELTGLAADRIVTLPRLADHPEG